MNLQSILEMQANYKLEGRTEFQGLKISIENKKGSVRKGKCEKGKPWSCWKTNMTAHYGYITDGVEGVDGDKLDVFIGPNPNAGVAYVVHTKKAPAFKDFDEDKCMLGFNSAKEAKKAFIENYGGEEKHFGSMDAIPMKQFKEHVLHPDAKPQKLVRSKLEEAMETEKLAAMGEPNTYGGGMSHIDPQPTFHPPSLKKPRRVPVDDPKEDDDRFLDVTKRKSKETKKFRDKLTKQHNTLGGIPPNTAVNHHTAMFLPFVTNG